MQLSDKKEHNMNTPLFFAQMIDNDNEQVMLIAVNSTNPEDLIKLAVEHESVARKLREAASALSAVRGSIPQGSMPISASLVKVSAQGVVNADDPAGVSKYLRILRAPTGLDAMINAIGSKSEPVHVDEIEVSVKQQGAELERGSILSNLSRYKDLFVSGPSRGYWTLTPQTREKYEREHPSAQSSPSSQPTQLPHLDVL